MLTQVFVVVFTTKELGDILICMYSFFTKNRSEELSHIEWLEEKKKAQISKMDDKISWPESYSPRSS